MPYKSEKKGILIPRDMKKNVKIPIGEHENVRLHYLQSKSQRATAKHFGVSRSLIRFICFPDKLKKHKENQKQLQKEGRYYDKEKHTVHVKEYRKRKNDLFKKGKCELSTVS